MAEHGEFVLVPSPFGSRVQGRLAPMRKSRSWSVHPTDDGRVVVEADDAVGMFDFRTRSGLLNTRGNGRYRLARALGAREFEFPAEFVAACLRACPTLDSETTTHGVTFANTIRVLRVDEGRSEDVE